LKFLEAYVNLETGTKALEDNVLGGHNGQMALGMEGKNKGIQA